MSQSEPDFPIPPASLDFLIASLHAQAEMHLGLIHFGPQDERPEPNLPLARHAIDMLGVLSDKTRGNLTIEESRTLENSLTELRFRYIQVSDRLKAETDKPAEPQETIESAPAAEAGESGAGA